MQAPADGEGHVSFGHYATDVGIVALVKNGFAEIKVEDFRRFWNGKLEEEEEQGPSMSGSTEEFGKAF